MLSKDVEVSGSWAWRSANEDVSTPMSDWSTCREKLLSVIRRKAMGEQIVTEPLEEKAGVLDLMAAVEASLEANKSTRPEQRANKSA